VKEVLSDAWYKLYRYRFEYLRQDGTWDAQSREVFDRGNGAAVLMYDPSRKCVLLTKQFRMPTALNGNSDGMLLEVCAGVLDEEDPEMAIRREIFEETGYNIAQVSKIGSVYTSPGAVTEILHLFMAEYYPHLQVHSGGGNPQESEDIVLVEYSYSEIRDFVKNGQCRDAKTLILLQHALLFGPLPMHSKSSII
jgi:nudix-type nucleoside diphosphatase (YffH/AdpP family)